MGYYRYSVITIKIEKSYSGISYLFPVCVRIKELNKNILRMVGERGGIRNHRELKRQFAL